MKHKTADLSGALLDAAVAKAEGHTAPIGPGGSEQVCAWRFADSFAPSTNWADGGPIIERERIALDPARPNRNKWVAQIGGKEAKPASGSTPLIAAMRAYVASKLGDEIDLP